MTAYPKGLVPERRRPAIHCMVIRMMYTAAMKEELSRIIRAVNPRLSLIEK